MMSCARRFTGRGLACFCLPGWWLKREGGSSMRFVCCVHSSLVQPCRLKKPQHYNCIPLLQKLSVCSCHIPRHRLVERSKCYCTVFQAAQDAACLARLGLIFVRCTHPADSGSKVGRCGKKYPLKYCGNRTYQLPQFLINWWATTVLKSALKLARGVPVGSGAGQGTVLRATPPPEVRMEEPKVWKNKNDHDKIHGLATASAQVLTMSSCAHVGGTREAGGA
mmetsp:Transcript_29241/g.78524  ORF Transcript_29241/g.78524 Transcript_29241/m.78524 type:complete len:222 (+) Transcript_29241:1317-1982(+)